MRIQHCFIATPGSWELLHHNNMLLGEHPHSVFEMEIFFKMTRRTVVASQTIGINPMPVLVRCKPPRSGCCCECLSHGGLLCYHQILLIHRFDE
jgi:hypothetical protein